MPVTDYFELDDHRKRKARKRAARRASAKTTVVVKPRPTPIVTPLADPRPDPDPSTYNKRYPPLSDADLADYWRSKQNSIAKRKCGPHRARAIAHTRKAGEQKWRTVPQAKIFYAQVT